MCDNDNASAAGDGDGGGGGGGSNVVACWMANSMPNYIYNNFGEAYERKRRCICVNGVRCSVCSHTLKYEMCVYVLLVHSYFHYSVFW